MPMSKYERVAADLREKIRTGQLKPGMEIPSTAQLVEQWGFSQGTIRTAILILKTEGLLRGQPGEHVYVREDIGGTH